MTDFISNNTLLTSFIIVCSLLLTEALASVVSEKARIFSSRLNLALAILGGTIIVFSETSEAPDCYMGLTILVTTIGGPIYGCMLYAVRHYIIAALEKVDTER